MEILVETVIRYNRNLVQYIRVTLSQELIIIIIQIYQSVETNRLPDNSNFFRKTFKQLDIMPGK